MEGAAEADEAAPLLFDAMADDCAAESLGIVRPSGENVGARGPADAVAEGARGATSACCGAFPTGAFARKSPHKLLMTLLTGRDKRTSGGNTALHSAHATRAVAGGAACVQARQKVCPQGHVTGDTNALRQIGHDSSAMSAHTPLGAACCIRGKRTDWEVAI